MIKATLTLVKDYQIGSIDERLFGGFAEHIGRCIYGGLYEPGHGEADDQGFRQDVLELTRELNMPVMRYPGGNFVSGYHWLDGVGPREQRPKRLEPAWKSVEPNQFGTNEFIDWCRKAQTEPLLAVNLGTGSADEARALVEYCNHPGGTAWSDLRQSHGWAPPHGVKYWCLGNEMDGNWQMGHKTGEEYGRVACEAGKLMKMVDPSIELVACGSSAYFLPTFGQWEWDVLNHTYEVVDYISLHAYYGNGEDDTPSFLARVEEMDIFIKGVKAICDAVKAKKKNAKTMQLSLDEWNVWFHSNGDMDKVKDWTVAPPILEDVYTMEDALVVGLMLITLINHADRVKIGCLAQLVNVIGAIMTETGGPAWRQTIFWPFSQASNLGRGVALQGIVKCDGYDCAVAEKVTYLKAASVYNEQDETVTIFAVNRSLDEEMQLSVNLAGFDGLNQVDWQVLAHSDLKAVNSKAAPDNVKPIAKNGASIKGGNLEAVLPSASWNVLRIKR